MKKGGEVALGLHGDTRDSGHLTREQKGDNQRTQWIATVKRGKKHAYIHRQIALPVAPERLRS
jgi:hypothetical protein